MFAVIVYESEDEHDAAKAIASDLIPVADRWERQFETGIPVYVRSNEELRI